MACRSFPRRRRVLFLEALEDRLVLDGQDLIIPLDPAFDLIGTQIPTIMAYEDISRTSVTTFFDTGAGAVIFSADDQAFFQDQGRGIPIKVKDGYEAGGLGGIITGDVSEPGTILVQGWTDINIVFDQYGFPFFDVNFGPGTHATPGIQVFVGTEYGSPILPTITGTPVLSPTPMHPGGVALYVDMYGGALDLSDLIEDLVVAIPGVSFPDSGAKVTATELTTQPYSIPIELFGLDTYEDPGLGVTEGFNPLVPEITAVLGDQRVEHGKYLFDTGAMISAISSEVAEGLGLDPDRPEFTLEIQGAAGIQELPGFVIDQLVVTRLDGGHIIFTDVPVFILDIAEGIDGIFGMNLLNWTYTFSYDPYHVDGPQVAMTFLLERDTDDGGELFRARGGVGYLQQLGLLPTAPLGSLLPGTQSFSIRFNAEAPLRSLADANLFRDAGIPSLVSAAVPGGNFSTSLRPEDARDLVIALETEGRLDDLNRDDLIPGSADVAKAKSRAGLLPGDLDALDPLRNRIQDLDLYFSGADHSSRL